MSLEISRRNLNSLRLACRAFTIISSCLEYTTDYQTKALSPGPPYHTLLVTIDVTAFHMMTVCRALVSHCRAYFYVFDLTRPLSTNRLELRTSQSNQWATVTEHDDEEMTKSFHSLPGEGVPKSDDLDPAVSCCRSLVSISGNVCRISPSMSNQTRPARISKFRWTWRKQIS